MTDRMKHRFVEQLGEWLQLLWEMGVITKKELNEVLARGSRATQHPARPNILGSSCCRPCCRRLSVQAP